MRITMMNGNGHPQNREFEEYVARLATALMAEQHTVTVFTLRDLDIKFCTGCFGCWVKTPGECVAKDASHDVCRAVINGDFLLWAAPLRLGFPDATLKKMMDKSIPLIHPYFVVDHGEAHHRPRYEHYPRVGLLLEKEADTDAEDLRIVSDIFSRTALNMKSRLEFAFTTEEPVDTVARAIVTQRADGVLFDRDLPPLPGARISPPTQLTIFNGSPRGAKGNTPVMLEQVARGFTAAGGQVTETYHLARQNDLDRYRDAFAAAEAVLVGFPLYTDAMPGIVKTFIEALEPLRGRSNNPALGFVMQSGFPESAHLRHVERYLAKLAARLGSPYLGALIKGGGEGIRLMSDRMNRKLFEQLTALGQGLRETGQFDPDAVQKLAKPERYPAYLMPVFKLLVKMPLLSMYWDNQLKENGVYEQRFAQPFKG
ncbi:MAG TPA: NAD(P)H-dependent oxidoreductase [Anaerolineae bacterium]|nr:NAD(P)H-dependent oxidoreductase [Anaerolineae bacterium]HQI87300.1 NAD(P)H-dependent oxidoreductase [Anaerolineae bacterium]